MKFLYSLLLLINSAYAAVSGITEGCPENAQLIANEGDKFVIIRRNGKDSRLESVSGEPFSLQGKAPVTFRSKDLEFEMTSVVMSSLPRLTVTSSGMQNKCRVNIYGNPQKQN